jgi:hypothetical protein
MDTTTTTTSRQPTTDTDHTARLARRSSLIACLIVAAVSISACGGGEIESSAAPEPPAPAPTRPVEGDSVAEHATDELDDDEFNEAAAVCFQGAMGVPEIECPTGQLAIVVASTVQSAPTILEPSTHGPSSGCANLQCCSFRRMP